MRRRLHAVCAALVIPWVAAAHDARADPGDKPLAEALFREGRRLLEAGDYAAACPKLAESERIDPKIGTLLNLAACHELEGRTATAWAEYTEAATQAARAGRGANEQFAREHAAALERSLPRLVLRATADEEGLTVSLDGEALGAGGLGVALPVDPGDHVVRATAPRRAAWSSTVRVAKGASRAIVVIPRLADEGGVAAASGEGRPSGQARSPGEARSSDGQASGAPTSSPASSVERSRVASTRRGPVSPWAWPLAGVAVVGAGVGTYFGLRAFAKNGDASAECPRDACTARGLQLDADARSAAAVSTVAFGVSVAAAAAATYLVVWGARSADAQVAIGPRGVALEGRW